MNGNNDSMKRNHVRRRVHQVLDIPQADDLVSQVVGYTLVVLIILNVLAVILESVQ